MTPTVTVTVARAARPAALLPIKRLCNEMDSITFLHCSCFENRFSHSDQVAAISFYFWATLCINGFFRVVDLANAHNGVLDVNLGNDLKIETSRLSKIHSFLLVNQVHLPT